MGHIPHGRIAATGEAQSETQQEIGFPYYCSTVQSGAQGTVHRVAVESRERTSYGETFERTSCARTSTSLLQSHADWDDNQRDDTVIYCSGECRLQRLLSAHLSGGRVYLI